MNNPYHVLTKMLAEQAVKEHLNNLSQQNQKDKEKRSDQAIQKRAANG